MSIRKLYYKINGVNIGKNVIIHFKTEIRYPYGLSISDNSIIGDNALLDARNNIFIGKNVNLSSNVSIYTLQHDHRDPDFGYDLNRKMSVSIHDRAWLGCNVVILPGVEIGEGAVVCAGAVVTKDVPAYSIVAGVPATSIGERNHNLRYNFNGLASFFY